MSVRRSGFPNPFISIECQTNGIEAASIPTLIYETYAQCNEDLIVEALLRAHLSRTGRSMDSIRYIEIGANHPFQTSSTYLFYKIHGASGVLVEAIPALADRLRQTRPRDVVVNCAISALHEEKISLHIHEKSEISSVSTEHIGLFQNLGGTKGIVQTIVCDNLHINDFLQRHFGNYCDYMSIDVEGLDLTLVTEMDTCFQPFIIQCEHEGRVSGFVDVLKPRGYALLAVTDVNAIFARAPLS